VRGTAGGAVQVGEKDLAAAQEGVFVGQRLLDFHDEVGRARRLRRASRPIPRPALTYSSSG